MAVDIGPRIGIDGEKQFRDQLKNVNESLKTLQSEMKLVTNEFKNNADSEEALTKKNDVLERSVLTLKDKLEMQQKALAESVDKYGEADTKTMKWQQAVNETQAALADAENEIKANNDALAENAKKSEEAGDKGKKFGETLKDGAIVAAAALAAVTTAVVEVGKQMFNMAKETATAGDEIDKNSQKVGLSAESYQKWDYAMKICGTEMSSATTGLKTLTNKFDDAKSGASGAVSTFERLGLSMEDISGLGREELFQTVVNSLQNVTDETEKAALANDLFGKSGQDLMPMFNMTEDELNGLLKEADEYGMVMSDEAVKASAAFKDSLTKLDSTFEGVKNRLVSDLLPGLTDVTDGLAGLLAGQDNAGEKIKEGFNSIIENLASRIPQLSALVSMMAGVILQQAPGIISALAQGILSAVPELTPVVLEVINTLTVSLVELLPDIMTAGVQILTSLISGISGVIPDLIPVAVETIITIVEALIDNVDQLVDSSIAIIMALADGLINALPTLIDKAPVIVQKLVSAIIQNAPKLIEAALQLIVKLVKGLIDNLPKVGSAALDIVATILRGIADSFVEFVNMGGRIVQGIIEGIDDAFDWAWRKIKEFFQNVLDKVKDFLGIHSPATKFMPVGEYMAKGIGVGWDKAFPAISKDINNSMSSLLPNSEANIGVVHSIRGTNMDGVRSAMADAVNALGMMHGEKTGDLVIIQQVDGREFYRATLKDFRLIAQQNPIIVNDF